MYQKVSHVVASTCGYKATVSVDDCSLWTAITIIFREFSQTFQVNVDKEPSFISLSSQRLTTGLVGRIGLPIL